MRIALGSVVVVVASVVAMLQAAPAQDFPTRPIRVIVGPGPDIVPRLLGPKMTDQLGQQVIVEPRPGAGGVIAAQTVSSAPPDGYMLLQATASYTINTALQTSQNDIVRDFTPVGLATTSPFVLLVNPNVPAKTVGELIAYAKANPGKLNYASSGVGTPPHLAGELFRFRAGIDIVHVPYREANAALASVITGATQMTFALVSIAVAQVSAGTVRALGVTSPHASSLAPGMPAIAEAGVPGFDVVGWNGYVGPKDMPAPVVAKLNATIMTGLADADVRKRLIDAGYEPAANNTPQQFGAFIAADVAKWRELVEKTNMKAN